MSFLDPRLPDRFWSKVMPEPNSGCWLWIASTSEGYGQFYDRARNAPARAHRVAYTALVGPILDGLHIDHLCRQTICCNPAHLEPVTLAENTRRGRSAERTRERHAAISNCPQGHPYDEANTYRTVTKEGRPHRMCKACRVERVRAFRARQRISA